MLANSNPKTTIRQLLLEAEQLWDREHKPGRALQKVRQALRLDRNNPGALVLMGRIHFGKGLIRTAWEYYSRALLVSPLLSEALLERARCRFVLDKGRSHALKDVRAALSSVRKKRRVKAEALELQGDLLAGFGKDHKAILSFRSALRLSPNDPGLHRRIGACYLVRGHPRKAMRYFNRAIALLRSRKRPDEMTLAFAIASKAAALNETGKNKEAMSLIQAGLRFVKDRVGRADLLGVLKQTKRRIRS